MLAERIGHAGEHRHQRIVAEAVVVVEVFVAEAEPEDPLLEQGAEGMFDAVRIAMVAEAVREEVEQAELAVEFAE